MPSPTPPSPTSEGIQLSIRHSHTVIPHKLCEKILTLRLTPSLLSLVLNFFDRQILDRIGNWTLGARTVSIGTPQGCVRSLLQYTLFNHDFVAFKTNASIMKLTDDTTVTE